MRHAAHPWRDYDMCQALDYISSLVLSHCYSLVEIIGLDKLENCGFIDIKGCNNTTIKAFQSDGGGEYTKRAFQNFLVKHGIQFRSSCPHHPEQNGIAERKHRHIVDTGLTLLAHASMPLTYWVEAFSTAVYLINRLPTKVLHQQIPFTKLFHEKPKFDTLRTFGSAFFPCLRPYNAHKLHFRSKLCVFIGYSSNHMGYRCLDVPSGRVYLSRHVVFDKQQFPFSTLTTTTVTPAVDIETFCLANPPLLPILSRSPSAVDQTKVLTPPLNNGPVDNLAPCLPLPQYYDDLISSPLPVSDPTSPPSSPGTSQISPNPIRVSSVPVNSSIVTPFKRVYSRSNHAHTSHVHPPNSLPTRPSRALESTREQSLPTVARDLSPNLASSSPVTSPLPSSSPNHVSSPSSPPRPSSPSELSLVLPTDPPSTLPQLLSQSSKPSASCTAEQNRMVTRLQSGIRKPNPKFAMNIHLSTPPEQEPTSYTQASKSPEWRTAMGAEFDALIQAGTWTLVPPTSSMNILPNKWVFKIKRKSDGSIERYKARLVANGFHQQEGLDFHDTFSPVVKHTTIRVILALTVSSGWCIKQLDVQNAFLHGIVHEEVYMRQPKGFVDPNYPSHVCRLHRSLYGLRQAPRAWHK